MWENMHFVVKWPFCYVVDVEYVVHFSSYNVVDHTLCSILLIYVVDHTLCSILLIYVVDHTLCSIAHLCSGSHTLCI